MEFDITSKRQSRYSPMGSKAVVKAEQLRPETNRKGFNLNPAPAADQKMAELMKENHQAQYKKKRNVLV